MNKEKGFTLVEVMIVVAIVGILLAVLIPQFTDDRGPVASMQQCRAVAQDMYLQLEPDANLVISSKGDAYNGYEYQFATNNNGTLSIIEIECDNRCNCAFDD